jgi:cytochrome c-type biogenesis protein CcmH
MITFIILAAALTFTAAAAIAIPLLRRDSAGSQASWTAFSVVGLLAAGAASLYVALSNWSWSQPPAAPDSPRNMVSSLARRLASNPQDLTGWLMLGRSYTVLEQYALAERAYERADRLAGGKNAEALVGRAEALTLENDAELDGRAGQLIEQALALDPKSGKAQFYGAAAALRRGDLPLARQRFSNLLALQPPANVRPIIEQQIAAIDQRLAGGGPSEGANRAADSATSTPTPTGTPAAPPVRVNVTWSPALGTPAASAAPLFVIVRDPAQPGPPLAAKRLSSHFPQRVELTTADSMLAGRTFTAGQQVEVVARIALSGSATGGRGDPFGLVRYRVGHDGLVDIVIDRLTP